MSRFILSVVWAVVFIGLLVCCWPLALLVALVVLTLRDCRK